ncbi:rho GTPase-activating protein 1-like isoform X2 [Lingula anatina]|uniref:Rho GTPase-activating protein 1-like isoform X2 n=1 Tax=Lingula anatina TaxID=7574 RepID=A0A1S3IBA8_LINAN|nr:rho GTPase-activating protein 1-like isoform X2 [Lingula anatina]|eukprot:XP_013395550.1 rho GTPase-activating protein 1-like isoform X2 [Lingula anatina]
MEDAKGDGDTPVKTPVQRQGSASSATRPDSLKGRLSSASRRSGVIFEDQEDSIEALERSGSAGFEWDGLEEPQFEFDDDLNFSLEFAANQELPNPDDPNSVLRSGAMTPDGLLDDDFEKELGMQEEVREEDMPFYDVAQHRIVEIAGDDRYGRKVIVFSACRLPPSKDFNHERLLQYLKHTLDQYVENDYIIVYFHYGLNSQNKPSFKWLKEAYREFDRKYKKNLKNLYLVHPTNFIKIILLLFRPIISAKFGKKIMYVNYLHELRKYIHIDQINIPERVREHDAQLIEKHQPRPARTASQDKPALDTQQFGVTLKFIKEQHGGEVIPPVVKQCVEFLKEHGLEVEGIFRRSANAHLIKEMQQKFNEGQEIDFAEYDINIPAVLLKSFLRELPEPIMTFELYPKLMNLHALNKDAQIVEAQKLLLTELPEENYFVLKYILEFITWVAAKADLNMMTALNLAIVFGPNLIWSRNQASIASLTQINSFTKLLIDHFEELFTK